MSKKQKIKELLDRLNTLDGSFLTPSEEELSDLTNKIITDEISNVTVKLKENTTIKSLERIATELNKIKNGDIMVSPQTFPAYIIAMRKAKALAANKFIYFRTSPRKRK